MKTSVGKRGRATTSAADYGTIVGLDEDGETISTRGTSDAALQAALIIQRNVDMPLWIIDTEYSFDLIFQDHSSLAELQAAIDNARRSQ